MNKNIKNFLFSGAGASFARDANKVGPPRENAVLQGCDQRVEGMSMNPIGSPLVLAVKVKVISTSRSYPELEDGRDAEADTV